MPLSAAIAPHLPHLRRYARALAGARDQGDADVRACLKAIVERPEDFPSDRLPKVALFWAFHVAWRRGRLSRARAAQPDVGLERGLEEKLRLMKLESRQVLLLFALEGFSTVEVAAILDQPPRMVGAQLQDALEELNHKARRRDQVGVADDAERIPHRSRPAGPV